VRSSTSVTPEAERKRSLLERWGVRQLAYLYFDSLRAVREMAAAAGLSLDPETEQEELAVVLARAALELPSPPHNALAVDPHREASKLTLLVAGLLY